MRAPLGVPGWGGLLVGDPEGYERRALGTGTSLYGGSVGTTCGGLIYWDFKIWLKGLWRWSVSLCGRSVKGTWKGLPPGEPEGYLEKSLWIGILTKGLQFWGTWRRACLSGTLKVERALGTGISFYRGSGWGTWRRACLPGL
jgi:hypothetical protein